MKPELFSKIFVAKDTKFGICTVRLCINGEWEEIIIDDMLPCYKKTLSYDLIFSKSKNQLWATLIEKALAKFFGNYNNLIGGGDFEG